jgi:hypothetical protein
MIVKTVNNVIAKVKNLNYFGESRRISNHLDYIQILEILNSLGNRLQSDLILSKPIIHTRN